ncbi:hypothetical protein Tco_1488636 [Tanacetum coccineum]
MITSTLSCPGCQRTHTWRPLFRPHPLQIACLALRSQSRHHLCQIMFEEDDDEDPEEDPVDYPADGGDDEDDEDEPSEEDEDDDVDIEAYEDEEEEEYPAPADSVVVALPAADQAPSAKETESFETDESAATPPPRPAYRVTARISIPAPVPTLVWSDAEVARLLAIYTPPSSPLSPWSSPLPQIPSLPLPPIPSPSLPVSSPVPVLSPSPPASPICIALGPAYEVGESSSAAAARPAGGLRAEYGFIATMDREIRHDPERDVGFEINDSWDEIVETLQGAPVSTDTELGRHMTSFETRVRQDTYEIYTRLDDEQSQRQLLAGRHNMLFRDRRAHAQVMSLRTIVLAQQSEIRELQSADRRRQTVISEMLAADYRWQKQLTEAHKLIKRLRTQMAEFERQQGPAKGPAQLELSEDAGSSSSILLWLVVLYSLLSIMGSVPASMALGCIYSFIL